MNDTALQHDLDVAHDHRKNAFRFVTIEPQFRQRRRALDATADVLHQYSVAALHVRSRHRRTGVVQDVPPDRLIPVFPDRLDAGSDKPDEKLLDLGEYDVIIAFDPDWTQLSDVQLKLIGSC